MLGSEIIAKSIADHGLNRVYVYPGGAVAPVLDALVKKGIDIFCSRHEQGAGYAALAAARLTGQPQVVIVTSGPGVTNVVTPVADAFFDSSPMIILTGQVGTGDLRGARPVRQRGFQEVDAVAIMRPITKAQFQAKQPDELSKMLDDAFCISSGGRPGPVLIDLLMDVQRGEASETPEIFLKYDAEVDSLLEPDASLITQAIDWLKAAERPVILAGQGVLLSGAHSELRLLAEGGNIPVSQTLLSLGAFSTSSPLALGFHGHTGNQYANRAIHEADLLLVVGSRLDVRQTGSCTDSFVPKGRIVRIDIDRNEIQCSRVRTDLDICADAKSVLQVINARLDHHHLPNWSSWHRQIEKWRSEFSLKYEYEMDGPVKPQYVIETASRLIAGQPAICVSGVGSHQQWVARHFDFDYPDRIWLTSGGHGAMGFDLPVAIGAQLTRPDARVLCFVGDGSLQMNIQELASISEFHLPVKIIVLDNHRLAMVSQFQRMNWGSDPACGNKWNPDFAAIGRAYGLKSLTVNKADEVEPILADVLKSNGPALVHCLVDESEDVVPLLLGGQKMDRMWPYV